MELILLAERESLKLFESFGEGVSINRFCLILSHGDIQFLTKENCKQSVSLRSEEAGVYHVVMRCG